MSSVGALILAVAYVLPLIYFGWSLIYGRRAGANPWNATGLEWQTSSPPPKENFHRIPRVDVEPYAYHDANRQPAAGGRTQGESA
jgi:cytochrome c oxidase subunit 1